MRCVLHRHLLGRLDVEGERLLDEDVLAGRDRGKGDLRVGLGRGADHDERDSGVGEEGVGVGVLRGDPEPSREPLPRVGVDVGDRDARHLRVSRSSPADGAPPPHGHSR